MNKQLQHKLFNYHAQPPAKVWDKIAFELDNQSEKPLPEKLANYELEPPPFVWDNIAALLNEEVVLVVPFKKRFSKPFKYSTAAASLIALAVLVSLLINKKSVSGVAFAPRIQQNTSTVAPPAPLELTDSLTKVNNYNRKNDIVFVHNKKKSANQALSIHANSFTTLEKRTDKILLHNYQIEKTDLLDRYIIFSKTPGEAFRLSKKLFDLFACSDDDENCKHNIQVMQQKLATSSVMAATDFPGVLDLLQNIENQ